MPARAAASAATEVMDDEEEQQQEMPGLQFNEPLSWRAGKSIPVAELLRRLQTLWKEMRDLEQEENERQSFTNVAKQLASPNLLAHKDKGVRAWTAACLVEILRLCAPDAPYTGQQLKVGSCSRLSQGEAVEAYSIAGDFQHVYYYDNPGAIGPVERLQYPAPARAGIAGASEKYCPTYGYTVIGSLDLQFIRHLF